MKCLLQYIFFLFILLLSQYKSYAQADDQLVQIGTEMYNFGDVKDALEVFKQALEVNPNNVKANYMAGRCYIETINKEKSLNYFLKAYELDPLIADNILYLIGHAYHLGYKFEKAIEYYHKYMSSVPNTTLSDNVKFEEIKKSERKIEECNVAKELVKSPQNILIENLGAIVNSVDEDYAPVISSDESTLYFTSRRVGSTGAKKDNDNEFFEDIYVSYNEKGTWKAPQNVGLPVNSELHDACVGISADGKMLFIYKDNDKYKGDIFYCKLNSDGKWSHPIPLSNKINTSFIEKAITISSDGKRIFFSSNRPGGLGGMDIYMSKLNTNGEWEEPVNLGKAINTSHDDDCPFLAADNKTLYFSSKGHKGMGGFDVFKSVLDTAKFGWSVPENLKYPINSPDDDMYFVLSGNGKVGYYASVKQDEVGDVDIYRIYMPQPHAPETPADSSLKKNIVPKVVKEEAKKNVENTLHQEASNNNVAKDHAIHPVVLNLKVVDKKGKALSAHIDFMETNNNKHVISENISGIYIHKFSSPQEADFIITAEKDGYIYKSHKIHIPASSTIEVVLHETFELEEVKVGARAILKNVYFDHNEATIKPVSFFELGKFLKLLKDHSSIKVEIDGHTDNQGTKMYNIHLSQRRAEAVIEWLTAQGIEASRLKAKGFGEQIPLASNDDEQEGREINRRTEFLILK